MKHTAHSYYRLNDKKGRKERLGKFRNGELIPELQADRVVDQERLEDLARPIDKEMRERMGEIKRLTEKQVDP